MMIYMCVYIEIMDLAPFWRGGMHRMDLEPWHNQGQSVPRDADLDTV